MDVDRRVQAVESFWKSGVLDPKTNVQFGEGGAGTFSDGKLTTRIHDPRCGYVMEQLTCFVRRHRQCAVQNPISEPISCAEW